MPRLIRTSTDIGRLVREARLRQGLTQSEVAGALGVTQKWISNVEGGKDTAPIGSVLRLLAALGVSLTATHTSDHDTEADMPAEAGATNAASSVVGNAVIDAVLTAHRSAGTERTSRPRHKSLRRKRL
ncbi:MAG: helix-turn-helix domain-containing protein [Algiphilus sp.]